MANLTIRAMTEADIAGVAQVHKAAFLRQTYSAEWIKCSFAAFPRTQFFVVLVDSVIQGYIVWAQKSGFRKSVVLELEQIAVPPRFQGQGLGKGLIRETLPAVKKRLAERGASIKHLLVTTRADNTAQQLYRNVLGAEVEATIRDLYSFDEVVMIVRGGVSET